MDWIRRGTMKRLSFSDISLSLYSASTFFISSYLRYSCSTFSSSHFRWSHSYCFLLSSYRFHLSSHQQHLKFFSVIFIVIPFLLPYLVSTPLLLIFFTLLTNSQFHLNSEVKFIIVYFQFYSHCIPSCIISFSSLVSNIIVVLFYPLSFNLLLCADLQ